MITGEDPGGWGRRCRAAAISSPGTAASGRSAAAASTSSRTRSPAPAAGTPTGSPCAARTRCQIGPCGQPAACVPGDQPVSGPRAAVARSAPITRPARSTVAAVPSSQRGSTSTRIPVFPHVILLGVLKLLGCLRLAWAGPIRRGYGHRCLRSPGRARSRNDSVAFRSV